MSSNKNDKAFETIAANPELSRLYNELLQGEKFNLILGAGCSIHCGIPDFNRLKKLIIAALSGSIHGSEGIALNEVDDASFESLWQSAGPQLRYTTISNWILNRPPHLGAYYPLATLIQAQYFHTIITYNLDDYLELALHSVGYDDFVTLINGCHDDRYVQTIIDDKRKSKILKTHGDHKHKMYALGIMEIISFGEKWREMLKSVLENKVLFIGYSADDIDFLRSMPVTPNGDEIWFINPQEPPPFLSEVMKYRHSSSNWISMRFEDIIPLLYDGLSYIFKKQLGRNRVSSSKRKQQHVSADLKIINTLGLHARPVALLIETVSRYEAEVSFTYKGHSVHGKSIMGLMMLAVQCGETITITADGWDAPVMVTDVKNLVENKFFEEE